MNMNNVRNSNSNSNPASSGIDLELNLGRSKQSDSGEQLTRAFPFLPPSLTSEYGVKLGRNSCSRCFSSSHSQAECSRPIRCWLYFRLGHIASSCLFPPHFPGLSKDGHFSPTVQPTDWEGAKVDSWFRGTTPMTGGPNGRNEPAVGSFQDLGRFLLGVTSTSPETTITWQCLPLTAVSGPPIHLPFSPRHHHRSHLRLPSIVVAQHPRALLPCPLCSPLTPFATHIALKKTPIPC